MPGKQTGGHQYCWGFVSTNRSAEGTSLKLTSKTVPTSDERHEIKRPERSTTPRLTQSPKDKIRANLDMLSLFCCPPPQEKHVSVVLSPKTPKEGVIHQIKNGPISNVGRCNGEPSPGPNEKCSRGRKKVTELSVC